MDDLPQIVGGGTVHWDAKVPRFWDIDFQQLSALGPVPGADLADWPFGYADLAPYYDEVEKLIGVQGDVAAMPDLVLSTRRARAVPDAARPAAARRRWRWPRAPRRSGLHPFPFPMAINSVPYNDQHACNDCGFCANYGCPVVAQAGGADPAAAGAAHRAGAAGARDHGHLGDVVRDAGHRGPLGADDRERAGDRRRRAPTWW